MVSPHLLKIQESFSTTGTKRVDTAKSIANGMWGDRPVLVMDKGPKKHSWCHMIWAKGPAISEDNKGSELIVIWWSEFEPDTSRVLSAIDWEKNAKDY